MAKDILFPNGAVFAVVPVDTDGDSVVDNATNSVRVTSVGASSGDGAILDGVTPSIRATVFDFTNSNPLGVTLRDTNGDPVSVGGGTQYVEDTPAAANPTGTAVNLIRQDTPAGLVDTNGDNVAQRGTNFGAAFVQIVSSAGAFIDSFGGGTQYTEDNPSAADPTGTQLIARRRDTLASETTADGDVTAVNSTAKGELYVKHVDSIPVTDGGGSLTVDGAVSITNPPTNRTASGTLGSLGATITINSEGVGTVGFEIDSGLVGDVTTEASKDGTNWKVIDVFDSTGTIGTPAFGTFPYRGQLIRAGEYTQCRLRVSAYTSGSSTARLSASAGTDNFSYVLFPSIPSVSVSGTVTANQGTPNSVANSWPIQITDGVDSALVAAGALLVNGSGVIQPVMATNLDIRDLVFATDKVDASGTTLGANSGVDIGDVTINNAAGASAVNIQDGGNTITVDGTVTVTATDLDIRNLVFATDKVDISGSSVSISGSVTVAQATASSLNAEVQGDAASDAPVSGNPVLNGGRASAAIPTAVSTDGDAVAAWLDLRGATKVAVVDDSGDSAMDGTNNALRVNVVAGGAGDGAILDGVSSSIRATVFDFANSNPLGVTLRDTNGDAVSVGGGTQYTEDDPAPGNPVGTAVALVRQDTPATLTTADGDIVAQRSTNYGAAYTQIVTSTGSFVDTFGGGTQYTEDNASAANPVGNQLIARRRDTPSSETDTDGDVTALNSTAKGELYVKHIDPIALKAPGTNLTASGALGALNDTVTINAEGSGGISFEIDTGTLVGVVSFEATLDDTNWFGIQALLTTGTVNNSVASFPSRGTFTNVTYSQVRLRVSTFTSGTSNARLESSVGSSPIVLLGAALPAGANSIGSVQAQGFNAQDIAISGNPLNVGFRASTAIPTAMSADGDSVYGWANRSGAPVVTCAPHVGLNSDPWNLVHEAAQYTTQQTSTILIDAAAGEKIVVTKVQIQAFATTAFDLQVYFGTGAFARGTNRDCFDGTFKPSATLAPGVVRDGPFIAGTNGDDLRVTTSAAGSVTISVWYYVVT